MRSRTAWIAVWALATAFACGATASADPESTPLSMLGEGSLECAAARPLRLALAWRDAAGVAIRVDVVEQEVRRIFAPAGIAIDWRLTSAESEAREDEILVLFLANPTKARPASAMGAVRLRAADRTARLFLSGIERLLGLRASADSGLRPAARQTLARAIGRVLAHELVHLLAPGLGHTAHGLMEARMQRSFALRPEVALDPEIRQAVLAYWSPQDPSAGRYASSTPNSSCTRSL